MDEKLEGVMRRIKQMLAIAADPAATDGERDNALRMAHKTLSKYNLDLSDITDASGKHIHTPQGRYRHEIVLDKRPWATGIGAECAKLNFCQFLIGAVWDANKGEWSARKSMYIFIGSEANARTAGLFAEEFVSLTYREYAKRKKFGRAVARSFATGVWVRLNQRVKELIEEEKQDQDLGNIHMLEDKANTEHIRTKMVVKSAKVRKGAAVVGSAFQEGMEHGDTLGLNRRV